jgi:predicted transcriptional regulator
MKNSLHIYLPEKLYKEVQLLRKELRRSMTSLCEEAIEDFISKKKKGEKNENR